MLTKLRKHLILLYTISASAILCIGLSVALFVLVSQSQQHTKDLLQNQMLSVISRLQFTYSVNNTWFTQSEEQDNMIIYVHQNNIPITSLKGSVESPTDRFTLINLAKEKALTEDVDITSYSLNLKQSSIFEIEGNEHDSYYATVAVLPADNDNFIGIILMYQLHTSQWVSTGQVCLLLGALLIGVLLFYLLGRSLVGKSLRPVETNMQKQNEFIAAVSHELKSPLAVTRANITALHTTGPEDDRIVSSLQNECKRMSRLIEDMLLLASSDAKTWSIHLSPVEIDTLIIECYENFERLCEEKNMPMQIQLPEESLPILLADKERLLQAVSILIDNAISYSQSPSIQLTASSTANSILIDVIDHGIGIPDDIKPLVFDRFYCMDRSRTNKTHFGLGLSIAHEIIKLHKGTILLENTPGGGSTFHIILPFHTPK